MNIFGFLFSDVCVGCQEYSDALLLIDTSHVKVAALAFLYRLFLLINYVPISNFKIYLVICAEVLWFYPVYKSYSVIHAALVVPSEMKVKDERCFRGSDHSKFWRQQLFDLFYGKKKEKNVFCCSFDRRYNFSKSQVIIYVACDPAVILPVQKRFNYINLLQRWISDSWSDVWPLLRWE